MTIVQYVETLRYLDSVLTEPRFAAAGKLALRCLLNLANPSDFSDELENLSLDKKEDCLVGGRRWMDKLLQGHGKDVEVQLLAFEMAMAEKKHLRAIKALAALSELSYDASEQLSALKTAVTDELELDLLNEISFVKTAANKAASKFVMLSEDHLKSSPFLASLVNHF